MALRVSEFISLDGVVQAPGGPDEDTDGGFVHGGWSFRWFDDGVGAAVEGAMEGVSDLLFGRRTWQVMADAWPGRARDPFADRMNALPKHVVSSSVASPGWNTTLIPPERWHEGVRRLVGEADGDVLVLGSAALATALLAEGLVEELCLMIEPLLLGGGKSIFPADGGLRAFELVSSSATGSGVLVARYVRAG